MVEGLYEASVVRHEIRRNFNAFRSLCWLGQCRPSTRHLEDAVRRVYESTIHEQDLAVYPRLIGGASLTHAHALFVVLVASPTLGLDMVHHAAVRYPSQTRT